MVDTSLFRQFGAGPSSVGPIYCVLALSGDRIVFEGLTTENVGDNAGIQSRNKIFNITGSGVVLRSVDITTRGSSPWSYGSLFGITGADVRKMNGIRVGWPARDVKLIGCRVHMRAMGHGIFIQGAQNTRLEIAVYARTLRLHADSAAEHAVRAGVEKHRIRPRPKSIRSAL
jgi:hypothetical protein